MISSLAFSQSSANYHVLPGKLHQEGKVIITTLSDPDTYKVQMDYKLKKKKFVPVSTKLLKGKTIFAFPDEFRTVDGYKELQQKKTISIPKATLNFIKRADVGELKKAYFLQVLPTNKKSKIDIIYHPSIHSVGWYKIKITFLSKIPVLNGYQVEAEVQ